MSGRLFASSRPFFCLIHERRGMGVLRSSHTEKGCAPRHLFLPENGGYGGDVRYGGLRKSHHGGERYPSTLAASGYESQPLTARVG